MRLQKRLSYLLTGLIFILAGCSGNNGTNKGLLPKASGESGEIILLMDSAKWYGKLGDAVKEVLKPSVEGLPRDEPLFSVRYVDPERLNMVLKTAKNMVFVTSFESNTRASKILKNYFTEESRKQIMNNPDIFMHVNEDEFARGQAVMYLFGKNDDELIQNLKNGKKRIQDFWNSLEQKRLLESLYVAKEVKGINERLLEEKKFMVRIPNGYQIAIWEDDFIWIRNMGIEIDRNLVFTFKTYTSQNQLEPESITRWRDQALKTRIFDDPEKPNSYITTEYLIPPVAETINFNGRYAVKLKGLWKTNNLSMGGPFVSYSFVDEELNRICYLEGFLYSPGKSQRELVRELDTILQTFKSASELDDQAK